MEKIYIHIHYTVYNRICTVAINGEQRKLGSIGNSKRIAEEEEGKWWQGDHEIGTQEPPDR